MYKSVSSANKHDRFFIILDKYNHKDSEQALKILEGFKHVHLLFFTEKELSNDDKNFIQKLGKKTLRGDVKEIPENQLLYTAYRGDAVNDDFVERSKIQDFEKIIEEKAFSTVEDRKENVFSKEEEREEGEIVNEGEEINRGFFLPVQKVDDERNNKELFLNSFPLEEEISPIEKASKTGEKKDELAELLDSEDEIPDLLEVLSNSQQERNEDSEKNKTSEGVLQKNLQLQQEGVKEEKLKEEYSNNLQFLEDQKQKGSEEHKPLLDKLKEFIDSVRNNAPNQLNNIKITIGSKRKPDNISLTQWFCLQEGKVKLYKGENKSMPLLNIKANNREKYIIAFYPKVVINTGYINFRKIEIPENLIKEETFYFINTHKSEYFLGKNSKEVNGISILHALTDIETNGILRYLNNKIFKEAFYEKDDEGAIKIKLSKLINYPFPSLETLIENYQLYRKQKGTIQKQKNNGEKIIIPLKRKLNQENEVVFSIDSEGEKLENTPKKVMINQKGEDDSKTVKKIFPLPLVSNIRLGFGQEGSPSFANKRDKGFIQLSHSPFREENLEERGGDSIEEESAETKFLKNLNILKEEKEKINENNINYYKTLLSLIIEREGKGGILKRDNKDWLIREIQAFPFMAFKEEERGGLISQMSCLLQHLKNIDPEKDSFPFFQDIIENNARIIREMITVKKDLLKENDDPH